MDDRDRHPHTQGARDRRWSSKEQLRRGAPQLWRGGSGCGLLSLAVVAVIVVLVSTGVLKETVVFLQGELAGGPQAKGRHRQMSNCRQLVMALRAYAGEHDGSYPPELGELTPEPLDEAELDRLLKEGSAGSPTGEAWILMPGLTTDSPAGEPLLIAAAPSSRGKRLAALNDASVVEMDEEEAARKVGEALDAR